MANSILYSEIIIVCSLVLLLLSIKVIRSMFLQEQRLLLFRVAVSNILFLMLDSVWIFVDNSMIGVSIPLNWLLNATYYILSGILGWYWFAFSETVQNSRLIREKRYRRLSAIPMILLVLLTVISVKTGWLFYIDAGNHYHRGPGYILQLLTSYGYVIFTAAKAYIRSFGEEDYRRKTEMKTLATYVLPTLITGGLQVFFPGYPILCIGNTFGILYIYLTMQEQMISLDTLTRLNNRNQLFQYLSTKLMHRHEDKDLYLLMMDVDYFKKINDQYGHVEGDRALKAVAGALMKSCSNHNYFISRYGGDEFIAICELNKGESIQPFCDTIKEYIDNCGTAYPLSVSIGYSIYNPGMKNQQDFIDSADQELYKVKKQR